MIKIKTIFRDVKNLVQNKTFLSVTELLINMFPINLIHLLNVNINPKNTTTNILVVSFF